ncbi:HAUS augmin-like complex subunit 1, partial [Tyto alba]
QVTLWLKKIHGSDPIPPYEVNKRTVGILYELAEYNEGRDRDVSILIEDMKMRAREYQAKVNHLWHILEKGLNISPFSLSSKGKRYLNVLVNSAMTLETKDTSLTSFFCAINDTNLELYETELKNRKMELKLSHMKTQIATALMLEKQLKEDIKKTEAFMERENAKTGIQSQKLKFLIDKSADIKRRIKTTKEQLIATGLDKSLTHTSLLSLSENLGELQKELAPLKHKLKSYLDLTPVIIFSTVLL